MRHAAQLPAHLVKIIFSRKGFDSSAGGVPSPLVAGTPRPLPIPTGMPSVTRYQDLPEERRALVADLAPHLSLSTACHLDPDLEAHLQRRRRGWRGVLGQAGAAAGHLHNQQVTPGDLFLFWGLYQPVIREGRWRFSGSREHRIFGWLQIGEILTSVTPVIARRRGYVWLADHPHVLADPNQPWPGNNTLYLAAEELSIPNVRVQRPGYGCFSRGLRLTSQDSPRPSCWSVPDWLNPTRGGVGMSYHTNARWTGDGTLRAAARGQEFVAHGGSRRDAQSWLAHLFGAD